MDGIASLPVNGYYSASKFALEGLTESLWQEIEPLGLRAFLVEPGGYVLDIVNVPRDRVKMRTEAVVKFLHRLIAQVLDARRHLKRRLEIHSAKHDPAPRGGGMDRRADRLAAMQTDAGQDDGGTRGHTRPAS